MKTLVGVDIGTQGTKASLFNQSGQCLATAFRASRLHRPAAGHVEEDPQDQVDAVCAAIRECVKRSGVDRASVAAVAIAGQMAGVIGVGADGIHVTPYDSWLDTRCAPQIDDLAKQAGDRILRQSGTAPGLNHAPKMLWWKKQRPRDYKRIAAFVQPGGYAAMRLCGLSGDQAFIDSTYLHFTGFADNRRERWDAPLAEKCGVDAERLPRIVQPQEIVGEIVPQMAQRCGLPAGVPVAAGCGDTAASFLAAGATRAGVCVDVAGTASVFAATTDRFVPDADARMLSVGRSAVPGLWHPYAYVNGGGMNLEWFRTHIAEGGRPAKGRGIDFDQLTAAAENLDGSIERFPLFIPHMEGRASPSQPALRGAWVGLDRTHTLAHLYRGVLEGVALEYALYQKTIEALYPGALTKELRVVGGGGASALWNTIKSDVLQMPLRTVKQAHGAPLGSAMLAGWAVGLLDDLPSAAARWIECNPPVRPDRKMRSIYTQRLARYSAVLDALNFPAAIVSPARQRRRS